MTSSFDEHYRAQLLDPSTWVRRANELLWVAEQLEPSITETVEFAPGRSEKRFRLGQGLGPYFMLVSFAVENLLNSVLVQTNRELLEAALRVRTNLPPDLKEHNLTKLADRVGFQPTKDTRVLLERLSRSSIWAGRYPVPTTATGFATGRDHDGNEVSLSAVAGKDFGRIAVLLQRVREFVGERVLGL